MHGPDIFKIIDFHVQLSFVSFVRLFSRMQKKFKPIRSSFRVRACMRAREYVFTMALRSPPYFFRVLSF